MLKYVSYILQLGCLLVVFSFSPKVYARPSVSDLGDLFQFLIPAYALGMSVNEKDIEGAKEFIYTYGATEITVELSKLVIHETRPDGSDRRSFPSGHTASAFSGASFIHHRYSLMQASVPYILAAFVGYSRIDARRHYFHDVLAGATIASLMSFLIVDKYIDLTVEMNQDKQEVGFRWRF